ncbi:MAG: phosphatase PAP2 family protein, partial [Gemmatimonadales bacterium]
WLLVAAAFWMHGRGGTDDESVAARDTALAILAAIAIGGLGAEALKILLRRERPLPSFEGYSFRPFADRPFNTGRLGLPSSHTMVAFAGAAALASRYPRIGWIVLGMAAGCGLTRLFAGAHFLSDVVAGAIGGILAGVGATRWIAARRRRARSA